jgi:tetratricopeptide (TPR) repeat protein
MATAGQISPPAARRRLFHRISRLALVFSLALASCVKQQGIRVPGDMGKRTWYCAKTEHLDIYSELDSARLAEMAKVLEERYRILEEVMFNRTLEDMTRTRVILFSSYPEFEQAIADPIVGGYFAPLLPFEADFTPTIVFYDENSPQPLATFTHEIAHRFVDHALTGVPVWLHEGLASYYESLSERGLKVRLGEFPTGQGLTTQPDFRFVEGDNASSRTLTPVGGLVRPSKLKQMDRADFMRSHFASARTPREFLLVGNNYMSAWGLVHFFMNGPEDVRMAYARALESAANGIGLAESLEREFSRFPPGDIDARYLLHVRAPSLTIWKREIERPTIAPPQIQELSFADRVVLQVKLYKPITVARRRAVRELVRLEKRGMDSTSSNALLGHVLLEQGATDFAYRYFKRCGQIDPKSPLCLAGMVKLYYRDHVQDRDDDGNWDLQITPDFAKTLAAFEASAQSATHFNLLAEVHLASGRPESAYDYALRGFRNTSYCVECLTSAAAAADALGRSQDAYVLQKNALELMPEIVGAAQLQEAESQLDRYAKKIEVAAQSTRPSSQSEGEVAPLTDKAKKEVK